MEIRKRRLLSSLLLTSVIVLASCSKDFGGHDPEKPAGISFRSALAGFSAEGKPVPVEGEDRIDEIYACVFRDGVLSETFPSPEFDGGRLYIRTEKASGNLYVLANAMNTGVLSGMEAGVLTEEEWLRRTAALYQDRAVNYMTSVYSLDSYGGGSPEIALLRGVARFDLVMKEVADLTVKSVSVDNVAGTSYCFPQERISTPDGASFSTVSAALPSGGVSSDTPALFYIYEQANAGMKVRVEIEKSGRLKTLEQELPYDEIRRNAVYTLTLHQTGIDMEIGLSVQEWGHDQTDLRPDYSGSNMVDLEASELGTHTSVSDDRKTVTIGYQAENMILAFDCSSELEVMPHGLSLNVTQAVDESGNPVRNRFSVKKETFFPGREGESGVLRFRRKELSESYDRDDISVILESHPVRMTGLLRFEGSNILDFKGYKDGDLGTVGLPEGAVMSCSAQAYQDEDAQWIKVEEIAGPSGNNGPVYSVTAGWRPNDRKARGEVQTGSLDITYADGSSETFIIKRRNYSLPVERIGGEYWCKFPLRGNVKNFEDQIQTWQDDTGNLEQYIQTCTPEQLFRIMGDQYLGGIHDAVTLEYKDVTYSYSGYDDRAVPFEDLPATEMAPEGYQIPTFEQMQYFSPNKNYNLGNSGSFTDRNGYKIWHTTYTRQDVPHLGGNYGSTAVYAMFSSATETRLVLCGLGYGDTAGNIPYRNMILMATSTTDTDGRIWGIEGWPPPAPSGKKGFWFKVLNNDRLFTRTIRCIKTPVSHMY